MAFYHNYLINRKIKQLSIDRIDFFKKYNLVGFNIKQINDFFNYYDQIENIYAEQLTYNGNTTTNPDKINKNIRKYEKKYTSPAGQLYLSSLHSIKDISFAQKNILYFLRSDYFNIIKSRKLDLFINDELYIRKAVFDNDIGKIDYLIKSGIKTDKKLNVLNKVGVFIDMMTFNKMLDYDLIDLSEKTQYPDLNLLIKHPYPLQKMVAKGFNVNELNFHFDYEKNNLEKEDVIKKKIQDMYLELIDCGLYPSNILKNKNLSFFYIASLDILKKMIKEGVDVNYKMGRKDNLLSKILTEPVFSEEDKKKKEVMVDYLLKNNAILKYESKNISNGKLVDLKDINTEIYLLLIKNNLIDFQKLKVSVSELNNNDIFNLLISKKLINFNNIFLDEYENLSLINNKTLSLLIKATKDLNMKMPNGNSIIEQSLIDNVYYLVSKNENDFTSIYLSGNDNFKEMFSPINGKITQFKHIYDEEMYHFLKNNKLLSSAPEYKLEDLNHIMYPIGKNLFKDGYITDDLVNPTMNDMIDPFYGSVKIYAIENKNLNKIKDTNDNDLLMKTYSKKMAKNLIKNGMNITAPLDKYHSEIRDILFNFLRSTAEKEKEILMGNIESEIIPTNKPKKRL